MCSAVRSLVAGLRLLSALAALGCACFVQAQGLVINEFQAANDTTVADQDGQFDDWIELYNNSATPENLLGYFLSDHDDSLTRWAFPDTTIAAFSYLIVWADNDDTQAGLHATFRLNAAGESIFLKQTEHGIVDQVNFGTQFSDISYGRFPNGSGSFHFMAPTFAAENAEELGDIRYAGDHFFDPQRVHRLTFDFYTDHWQDSLRYNFEVLDQVFLPARLTVNDSIVLDSIGIRYRGNSSYERSRSTPKKPLEIDFKRYIDDQNLDGLHRLNLSSSVSDPTFMRETIAYGIARAVMPASRTTYADVYVGNDLLGFYVLVEQMDKNFLSAHYGHNGGNLFKAADNGATLLYRGTDPADYGAEYELKTNEDENDWSRLIEFADELNNTPDAQFENTVSTILDFDIAVRQLALLMTLSSFDSYTGSGRNFYLYDDPVSGRFQFLPWDLNESFGVYTNNWNPISQDALIISNLDQRPLNRRLLTNEHLRENYLEQIDRLIHGPAAPDSVAATIALLRPLIEPHVRADHNKLYSDEYFVTNLHNDVFVEFGRRIPGLSAFMVARANNLKLQLSAERVFPGDTDNNGEVNALDILPVGVYFSYTGTPRDSVSLAWGGRRAALWNNAAATYADANGDGIVDERDVVAIGVNWGRTHAGPMQSYEVDPARLVLDAQTRSAFALLLSSLHGTSAASDEMRLILESILGREPVLPLSFTVDQNFPNPFNAATTITFEIPVADDISLEIFDVLGRRALTPLKNVPYAAGQHHLNLQLQELTSGIYFYKLSTAGQSRLCKMVLLR